MYYFPGFAPPTLHARFEPEAQDAGKIRFAQEELSAIPFLRLSGSPLGWA